MCWQLSPVRADDEEKMPQLTHLFTPDLNTFSEKFTTTSLSVDDLVKLTAVQNACAHCSVHDGSQSQCDGCEDRKEAMQQEDEE